MIVPDASQIDQRLSLWQEIGGPRLEKIRLEVCAASPYEGTEGIALAAKKLADCDLIALDCLGTPKQQRSVPPSPEGPLWPWLDFCHGHGCGRVVVADVDKVARGSRESVRQGQSKSNTVRGARADLALFSLRHLRPS